MKKHLLFIVLCFISCGSLTINAQVMHAAVMSAGGNATGTGGSASYSVGQFVYTTATGTTGSVAQGVQQPYEINVVSGIGDIFDISLFSAYPNPASTHLLLKIENNELSTLSYQLTNTAGSVIKTARISAQTTTITMATLTASAYFLRIFSDKKEIKVFKIIKN